MKEAHELLEALETDLPAVADKAQALRLALQCEPDNAVIVRYNGLEHYYLIDEETSQPTDEFECNVPLVVRIRGIHQALRCILQVPEAESILSIALFQMRRIKNLEQERMTLITQLAEVDRRGKQ
jgi:hypothetical protein